MAAAAIHTQRERSGPYATQPQQTPMPLTGTTPGADPTPLTADEHARFIGLTFQGVGALSRLLRTGAALSAAGPDPWTAAMGKVLDEVGSQWGIQLS